jgi:hypothetical protein
MRLTFCVWAALQPRPWHEHKVLGKSLHVLYGLQDTPMFICKELCRILDVSDTSLAYWKKKANAEEMETSQDFKLMYATTSLTYLGVEHLPCAFQ